MDKIHIPGLAIMALICLLAAYAFAGEYYRYRDAEGVLHFTDNLNDVPESQRDTADRYKKVQTEAKAAPPRKKTAPDRSFNDKFKEMKPDEQLKALNNEKQNLETLYGSLLKRVETLEKLKKKPKSQEDSVLYEQKVSGLNKEISSYEKRRAVYERQLKAYKETLPKTEHN